MTVSYVEIANQNMDKLAEEIFQLNKKRGWWDNMDRDTDETLQLVSTEVAEATEGYRKDLMDDKIKHRKMEEVELADALIRVLDLGGRYGWKYDSTACTYDGKCCESHAAYHLLINKAICALSDEIKSNPDNIRHFYVDQAYSELVNTIMWVSQVFEFEIMDALKEKFEYNKTRKDHSREERAKKHGKKI